MHKALTNNVTGAVIFSSNSTLYKHNAARLLEEMNNPAPPTEMKKNNLCAHNEKLHIQSCMTMMMMHRKRIYIFTLALYSLARR